LQCTPKCATAVGVGCGRRNGSVRAAFEMLVVSDYVSEYCVWLVLRDGLEQLAKTDKLPFHIVDINTTGIVLSGTHYFLYLINHMTLVG